MAFRVGDLVAEDHTLYWYFYNKSFTFVQNESDPEEGNPKQVIGIITTVHKRYPDQFFDIPYFVYGVKWLNAPHGSFMDARHYYEDELTLLSPAKDSWGTMEDEKEEEC